MLSGSQILTLVAVWSIFLSQYSALNLLPAFFPRSDAGKAIGLTMSGTVFSSYMFAMCLAMPLPTILQRRLGTNGITVLGLLLSLAASIIFGLLPRLLIDEPAALSAGFIICRAVAGIAAQLCETGGMTILTTNFNDRIGTVPPARFELAIS